MLTGITDYVRFAVKNRVYYNHHKDKIGLSKADFFRIKGYKQQHHLKARTTFLERPFEFTSPFWFIHSIDEIFVQEVYKYRTTEEEPVILDCGANVGLSVLYFKRQNPQAKVIAFEPDPSIFATLTGNLKEHALEGVELVNAAVWTEDTHLTFQSDGNLGGKIGEEGRDTKGIDVKAVRLRDYLSSPVDFLKIDIEGAEYEVLRDCRDRLSNVRNLFIEYHVLPGEEQHLHQILSWVHDAGFTYYIREAWNNMRHPFTGNVDYYYQMQLNISCYR